MAKPFKFDEIEDIEKLRLVIEDYFNTTPEEDWTVTGLAMAMDCDRDTLLNYEKNKQGQHDKVPPEIIRLIKKAKMKIHNAYEKDLRHKSRSGDIFALKNFGWSDRQEFDHTTKGEKINSFSQLSPEAQKAMSDIYETEMKSKNLNK